MTKGTDDVEPMDEAVLRAGVVMGLRRGLVEAIHRLLPAVPATTIEAVLDAQQAAYEWACGGEVAPDGE